ncbi:MAG TPA: hypothetical protein VJ890_22300, partial [Vineibacter sp.]|nr:hypothetical protein [Vineibacter sp.]
VYGKGPYVVILGPEHAQTLHRDGWTIESMQAHLFDNARIHVSRVSKENQESYAGSGHVPENDSYRVSPTAQDIHILVAGGPGKHSAWIPSFGGTAVISTRVATG